MTLNIIKYDNANALEATWKDDNSNVICHSYADIQMDMLRADALLYGTPLTKYEALISDIEANIVPTTPEPIVIPQVVTMRQARLALFKSNLLATVDAAIASGTDEAMKIEWEYATEVKRDWASLMALTTAFGMTSLQLDDLFLLASTL